MGSVASLSNLSHQKIYGQTDSSNDTGGGGNSTENIIGTGGTISGCFLSTGSCSVSDVLLNDDNSILCDPSNGTDCTLYLNSSQVTPSDTGVPANGQGNMSTDNFTEDTLGAGGTISGCLLSTGSCSVSDVLLNDDNSILCDPSNGTDLYAIS